METPSLRLTPSEAETVYEPSEDSYLLIDALELDLPVLESLQPRLCLEIGSGSGVVSSAVGIAALKASWFTRFLAIDINPRACEVTRRTGRINGADIDVARMDLTTALSSRPVFDLILFNPPYVATDTREIEDSAIARAWAGGHRGRQVMDRVFSHIPRILANNGLFYLVVLRENDPDDVAKIFEDMGMRSEVVIERKIRGEHLYVMRFSKVSRTERIT